MRSTWVLAAAELTMRAVAVASLVTVLTFAVFGAGAGVGVPNSTPKWVWDTLSVMPLAEDRFGPTALTVSTDQADFRRKFALDKEIATSMLEPGVEQDPQAGSYVEPEGVSIMATGTYRATFDGLGWWTSVGIATLGAMAALGLAAFWWIAAGVVRSARTGPPFTDRNARRLLVLGSVAVAGPTMWNLANRIIDEVLLAGTPAAGRFVPLENWWQVPHYPTIALGLVLLALGAIWRHGVRLERDVEGLV